MEEQRGGHSGGVLVVHAGTDRYVCKGSCAVFLIVCKSATFDCRAFPSPYNTPCPELYFLDVNQHVTSVIIIINSAEQLEQLFSGSFS